MRKYLPSSKSSGEGITPALASNTLPKHNRIRSRGSKIISVLRSLTNSVSSGEPTPATRKFSQIFAPDVPTVVHRTQFKSRPSVIEVIPDGSTEPSTPSSGGNDSPKSFRPAESTGKTSLDSKFSSQKSNRLAQSSSENKKTAGNQVVGGGSSSTELAAIAEVEFVEAAPVPTVVTVEKAAAARIFFETHYNTALIDLSPRSIRCHNLECAIIENPTLSAAQQEEKRREWFQKESEHLRENRVMKVRGLKALQGKSTEDCKYEVIKVLGKGSFGVVRLVREKNGGDDGSGKKEIYAMKVIRKSDMLRNCQEGHLRAERDFLVSAEGSRWIVPLIASFQDLNNLYLIMDYMPGGDFLGLLIRDNVLTEPVTKWYIAEMILCIEEAHALCWIHRDIKPDNFLISASGHLKISDFGLAFDGHWSHDQAYFNYHRYSLLTKLGISVEGDTIDRKEGQDMAAAMKVANAMMGAKHLHERTSSSSEQLDGILNWRNRHGNRTSARSVVGTSQYMAPEVVKGESYDGRCDWWSLAVILYECLYGHTPFLSEEGGRQQTKMNIVKHEQTFAFPNKPLVSNRCRDLIQKIIQEKDHRLCSKRYTRPPKSSDSNVGFRGHFRDYAGRFVYPNDAEDIKAHKWFKDIPWDHLHLMTPPFVPNIKSMDDTHYFDEEEPISDFSESTQSFGTPTIEDIIEALRPFNREIQILATGFIERPHDTARLRKMEREIDCFVMPEAQKQYLKHFVRAYGKKEKKRPRDKLLRDKEVAPKVLQLRKESAFLGYNYRRMRVD